MAEISESRHVGCIVEIDYFIEWGRKPQLKKCYGKELNLVQGQNLYFEFGPFCIASITILYSKKSGHDIQRLKVRILKKR